MPNARGQRPEARGQRPEGFGALVAGKRAGGDWLERARIERHGGDAPGDDYLPWTPSVGSHTLVATPYTAASAGGTAGTPLTVNFSVINTPPSGSPVASAGTDKSITLPTSSVIINGSGGPINGTYFVLSSTNIALPLTNWTRLLTNQFDATGNFIFTNAINAAVPRRFYVLQVPL